MLMRPLIDFCKECNDIYERLILEEIKTKEQALLLLNHKYKTWKEADILNENFPAPGIYRKENKKEPEKYIDCYKGGEIFRNGVKMAIEKVYEMYLIERDDFYNKIKIKIEALRDTGESHPPEPLTTRQTLTKDQEEKIYKKVSYEKQIEKKIFNNAKFNHFKEHLPILIKHQFIKQEDDGRYSWIKGGRALLAYYFSQLQRKNNPRVDGYVGREKPVNLSWAPIQSVFREKNLAQAYKESILADGKNGVSNLWDNELKMLDGIISGKIIL
ncbi:hypothetical protein FACS1894137_04070 [Spirochaetia bacterium]|nr:hypothetical protein FACS1894137_04070 [Spirochaetia bacterium]